MENKKYKIIYADPPWNYECKHYQDSGRRMKHINEQYNTMSIKEMKELPIKNILDKDCALFLWVTDSHLKFGIEVLESWGFKYKTIAFVWIKKYESGSYVYNFAPWTLKSNEICLLGIKGKMGKYKMANNIKSLVEEVRRKHSQKPEEVRSRIEKLFGNIPRIELFARERTEGWDAWGNEVDSDVKLIAKSKTQGATPSFNMGDKVSATPTPKSKSQRREWKW